MLAEAGKTHRAAIAMLGPPAAGKTTVLQRLASGHPGIPSFKVRWEMDRLVDTRDPIVVRFAPLIRSRATLPDALVRYAFRAWLTAHTTCDCIFLDGYPRNDTQFSDLLRELLRADRRFKGVISIDAPDSVLRRRVRGRLECADCHEVADVSAQRCTHCGGRLSRRPEDSPTRFDDRLAQHRESMGEARALYGRLVPIREVDATQTPERVWDAIRANLHELGVAG